MFFYMQHNQGRDAATAESIPPTVHPTIADPADSQMCGRPPSAEASIKRTADHPTHQTGEFYFAIIRGRDLVLVHDFFLQDLAKPLSRRGGLWCSSILPLVAKLKAQLLSDDLFKFGLGVALAATNLMIIERFAFQ
jgi:hypothetical protein